MLPKINGTGARARVCVCICLCVYTQQRNWRELCLSRIVEGVKTHVKQERIELNKAAAAAAAAKEKLCVPPSEQNIHKHGACVVAAL